MLYSAAVPHASLRGTTLHYDVAGDGPPVLLIMGFGMRGVGWSPLTERLLPDHRVAWFDNRGVGESGRTTRGWTMGEFSADAVALMDELGWDDAHVVGVSMGGMIAQHLGLDAPERVRSLSLLATTARGKNTTRPDLSTGVELLRTAFGSRRARLRALVDLVFSAESIESRGYEALMEEVAPAHGTAPLREVLAHKRAIERHDTRARLAEIAAPTLVVQPTADRMVNPIESTLLASLLPSPRLVAVDGAGHRVHADRPDVVAEAVRGFVAAHPGGSRDTTRAER